TYMPAKYTKHKKMLRQQMPYMMIDEPIILTLEFHFPLLKSWSKKKHVAMVGKYKRTKPDIDNLINTLLYDANSNIWNKENKIITKISFHNNKIIKKEKK